MVANTVGPGGGPGVPLLYPSVNVDFSISFCRMALISPSHDQFFAAS